MKSIQQSDPNVNNAAVKLRPKVAELVQLLQDYAGQPVPVDVISQQVWGYPLDESMKNLIRVTVYQTRERLPNPRWIVNEPGTRAYAWAGPVVVTLEQERAA